MKVFQMEHWYVDDTILMHAEEMELRVENEFNHTRDCQTAAAAGVCLTADIKQCDIRKENKRLFSRKGNVQWRARPNRQQIRRTAKAPKILLVENVITCSDEFEGVAEPDILMDVDEDIFT